ncbi:MAG: M48 family metallopeptidase [Alphaproteobacteria bacterium]
MSVCFVYLRPSSRSKRFILRVNYGLGAIELVYPQTIAGKISEKLLIDFVRQHQEWIGTHAVLVGHRPLELGMMFPWGDQQYHIVENQQRSKPVFHENRLEIPYSVDSNRLISRFLARQAKASFSLLTQHKKTVLGIDSQITINIRDTTSRWGSCNRRGQICYSWRLGFAPISIQDYVTAHEVAHLVHFDHSPAFWQLCRQLTSTCPLQAKKWLKDNGFSLQAWGRGQAGAVAAHHLPQIAVNDSIVLIGRKKHG